MARTFVAYVSNPSEAFARLSSWAQSEGFQLSGTPTEGRFSGRPRGLAAFLYPVISGSYVLNGTEVTIQTDQDLPADQVAPRLAQVGLQLIRSS